MAINQLALILFIYFAEGFAALVQDGFLPNGDFEKSFLHHNFKGVKTITSLPNWQLGGNVQYVSDKTQQEGIPLQVAHGKYALKLGNKGFIRQPIHTKKDTFYALTFSASKSCAQDELLRISINNESGDLQLQTVYNSNGDSYGWGFLATSSTVNVTFHNAGTQENPMCGPLIDAVSIRELRQQSPTPGNLMKNGDFEEGPFMSPNGVLLPAKLVDRASALPGWIIESLKPVKYINAIHFNVPYGRSAVELVAGRESAIAQIIRTTAGQTYNLSFLIGDARNDCLGNMVVEAFAGKETIKAVHKSRGKGEIKYASVLFKAISARTRITFFSSFYHTRAHNMVGTLCGPALDRVVVFPVRST